MENIFNWNIVKPGYCNPGYNEFMAVQIKLYGLYWLHYYINHDYYDITVNWTNIDSSIEFVITMTLVN